MTKNNNIIKYKSLNNFHIGFVVFLIIIIYVLFNVFSYFTKTNVAEYEVQQGTIASNYIYKGVAIRDESIEYADRSGFVNYYVKNASKVSTTDVVFSLDTTGTISNEISSAESDEFLISQDTLQSISKNANEFINKYNSMYFYDSYDFLEQLNSEITHTINTGILKELSDEVHQAELNHTFFKYTSPRDGIIVYYTDGLESVTVEEYLENGFSFSNYKRNVLESNRKVTSSEPIYKRIDSENWSVLISVDRPLVKQLRDGNSIKVRFCKDDFTINANYTILQNGSNYYLQLTFKTAMIRYANERFLDIELVMKDTSGLKIPRTAITSKEFFTIPKEYFTLGGDSDKSGILVKHQKNGSESKASFITPTIYYESEEYYYIDSEEVSTGDAILKENSVSSYIIGTDTDSLVGVYNINKGYAVFKQINIIYQNEEYAIVEMKTSYGISLYDHIALDANKITEHQLISK